MHTEDRKEHTVHLLMKIIRKIQNMIGLYKIRMALCYIQRNSKDIKNAVLKSLLDEDSKNKNSLENLKFN